MELFKVLTFKDENLNVEEIENVISTKKKKKCEKPMLRSFELRSCWPKAHKKNQLMCYLYISVIFFQPFIFSDWCLVGRHFNTNKGVQEISGVMSQNNFFFFK